MMRAALAPSPRRPHTPVACSCDRCAPATLDQRAIAICCTAGFAFATAIAFAIDPAGMCQVLISMRP